MLRSIGIWVAAFPWSVRSNSLDRQHVLAPLGGINTFCPFGQGGFWRSEVRNHAALEPPISGSALNVSDEKRVPGARRFLPYRQREADPFACWRGTWMFLFFRVCSRGGLRPAESVAVEKGISHSSPDLLPLNFNFSPPPIRWAQHSVIPSHAVHWCCHCASCGLPGVEHRDVEGSGADADETAV